MQNQNQQMEANLSETFMRRDDPLTLWGQFRGKVWTYASATTFTVPGDATAFFTAGTKIRLKQGGAYKYFYVVSSAYGAPNTTVTITGGSDYTLVNAAITDNYYSYANPPDFPPGWTFSGYVPLTSPLTSTSWDGDARSTTSKTKIDLSSVFGVPAYAVAVEVRLVAKDSGSASSSNNYIGLSPNNVAADLMLNCRLEGQVNDRFVEASGKVNCDSNGDIYFQCVATGSNTLDVYLQIWGYWT